MWYLLGGTVALVVFAVFVLALLAAGDDEEERW